MTTLALRDEFRRSPSLPMLLDDDIFIRGIRRGIEQGDYVYQRGDLLFGPGDPPADIRTDEQAVVMTMAYAKNKGVWPRPTVKPPRSRSSHPSWDRRHPKPPPTPPARWSASSAPRACSRTPWCSSGSRLGPRPVSLIATLTIRMFDAGDAFRLFATVGAVSGAQKVVGIVGGYETPDGGTFQDWSSAVRFSDAEPVKEFLGATASRCQIHECRNDVRVVVHGWAGDGG